MFKRILCLILFCVCFIAACSSLPSLVLKFQDRRYRPCDEREIASFRPDWNGEMLFCWRYCSKYRYWHSHISANCKVWTTDILETKEDFTKLRDAGFVLINEKRID